MDNMELSRKIVSGHFKRKGKKSDSVLWQKPLHPQKKKSKKQSDNTKLTPPGKWTQVGIVENVNSTRFKREFCKPVTESDSKTTPEKGLV